MPLSSPTAKVRRLQPGQHLVAATHNAGKVRELRELLAPHALSVVSAGELGLPEPEETGTTFRANAELKALAAAQRAGLPALADDSGLEVEALGGEPGVYSARWAGADRDFGHAMERLADELHRRGGWTGQPGPRANFTAVLCLAWPDGTAAAFEGKVFGHLIWPPRGNKGFGYDPMFVADGETLTFGEMEPVRKHAISHRARAFALFSGACLDGA
jgi:XTP/dITP diphosphohydrolase